MMRPEMLARFRNRIVGGCAQAHARLFKVNTAGSIQGYLVLEKGVKWQSAITQVSGSASRHGPFGNGIRLKYPRSSPNARSSYFSIGVNLQSGCAVLALSETQQVQ
jgi:hypothetical protein